MLDIPGGGWLCTGLYFPNIIHDPVCDEQHQGWDLSMCCCQGSWGREIACGALEMLSQHVGALPWVPSPRGQLMPEAAVDVAQSPGKQESGTKQGLFPQP